MFIRSADAGYQGAAACNLRGDVIQVSEFIEALKAVEPAADISLVDEPVLPFPSDLDDSGLADIIGPLPHTALADAITASLNQFRLLLRDGKIDLAQLEQ